VARQQEALAARAAFAVAELPRAAARRQDVEVLAHAVDEVAQPIPRGLQLSQSQARRLCPAQT
jgi:hypothetical protein